MKCYLCVRNGHRKVGVPNGIRNRWRRVQRGAALPERPLGRSTTERERGSWYVPNGYRERLHVAVRNRGLKCMMFRLLLWIARALKRSVVERRLCGSGWIYLPTISGQAGGDALAKPETGAGTARELLSSNGSDSPSCRGGITSRDQGQNIARTSCTCRGTARCSEDLTRAVSSLSKFRIQGSLGLVNRQIRKPARGSGE
jgi:hypothetical protein